MTDIQAQADQLFQLGAIAIEQGRPAEALF